MTNTPIGIPSGWEEIAAWFYCWDGLPYFSTPINWGDMIFAHPYDIHLLADPHDWRVEE